MKTCPLCPPEIGLQTIDNFGICRARRDGRNLYCKSCIRKKVSDSRQLLREYKFVRRQAAVRSGVEPLQLRLSLTRLSPLEKVRDALKNGARTHNDILRETKLTNDEVSDAIANLLLWTGEIRTSVVENERHYFINETVEKEAVENSVQRKPDLPCSFSSIKGLMPGKKVETKIGGWVAA